MRLPERPRWPRRLLLVFWLASAGAVVGRASVLQVKNTSEWRELSAEQHQKSRPVPSIRGSIRDRDGVLLAQSREVLEVAVAPGELRRDDNGVAAEAVAALQSVLGLSASEARRRTESDDPWVVVPGRYPTTVRSRLEDVRGVYLGRDYERFRPHGDLVAGVLGTTLDRKGAGGIEEHYDDILSGQPGEEMTLRDARGVELPGRAVPVKPPVPGGDVSLTIDVDLQEIAREELQEAIRTTGAKAGDLLVTDPGTGEILAVVSIRDGDAAGLAAINTASEPGSTLKPFTVAAILSHGVGTLADSVDIGNGSWYVAGRTLSDVYPKASILSLADALRVSSNVGVAKMAGRLSSQQQYEMLRDFGFGMPTGLPIPGETSGTLRRPEDWSGQSPVSLAIGYEISVSPLQLAMAYGALANGGRLLAPKLIREVRTAGGSLIERSEPRVIRQVISSQVARDISGVLVEVTESGTGTRARLTSFSVAGKSGTSRAYRTGGGYAEGEYFATFVGFFPAEDPQLLAYVKLESPKGVYYGGATAAPVIRATMEAILAAEQPPVDRRVLAHAARRPVQESPVVRFALAEPPSPGSEPTVWESGPAAEVVVPDVRGLSARAAARQLHMAGLRVVWEAPGSVFGTWPAAGTVLIQGDTVAIDVGRAERERSR